MVRMACVQHGVAQCMSSQALAGPAAVSVAAPVEGPCQDVLKEAMPNLFDHIAMMQGMEPDMYLPTLHCKMPIPRVCPTALDVGHVCHTAHDARHVCMSATQCMMLGMSACLPHSA
jgi:hypothetical protein